METKDIPLALSCEQLWVCTQDMQLVRLSSKGKFLETQFHPKWTEKELLMDSFSREYKKTYGKKPKIFTQLMPYVEEWTRKRNKKMYDYKILKLNLFSLA